MLTLTRPPGSITYVDGPCAIRVVKDNHGHIRLTFDAPPGVIITRAEILADESACDALKRAAEVRDACRKNAMSIIEQLARAPDAITGTWGAEARKILADWPRGDR